MNSHHSDIADPLAIEGPYIKKAYIWIVVVAIIASLMVWKLSGIDRRFYDHDGKYLDYDVYRANRSAATSIPSERIDERRERSLIAVVHPKADSENSEGLKSSSHESASVEESTKSEAQE